MKLQGKTAIVTGAASGIGKEIALHSKASVLKARALGITEAEVIKNVMLKETVDGQFTTAQDIAEVALLFAAFPSNVLTGQSLIASHGWFME